MLNYGVPVVIKGKGLQDETALYFHGLIKFIVIGKILFLSIETCHMDQDLVIQYNLF
jgi:hypothetical protein